MEKFNVFKKIIKNNIFMLTYIYRFCPCHIFVTLLSSMLASLSSVFNLFITRYIINTIQTGADKKLLFTVTEMVLLLFLINLLCSFINAYIQQRTIPKNSQIISRQMQAELFNKASTIELKFYDEPSFYNVFSMALQQSDIRAQSILDTLNMLIANSFGIGAMFALIFVLEPVLLGLVIFNVTISFGINTIISKLQHSFEQERIKNQRVMEYSKFIFFRMENAKELRMQEGLKNVLINKLFKASIRIEALIEKYGKKRFLHTCLYVTVNNAISSATLIYLAYKVIKGRLFIGDFVTLSSSAQQLSVLISELISAFPQMYEHSLYVDNFKEFIAYPNPVNYENGLSITSIKTIKLNDVSFRYPLNETYTLKHISLEINSGEIVAIVGENGAGKSTLVKLLMGLYDASVGDIMVNGRDIKTYELNNFRKCISAVFQDYKIYALSIAENILMKSIDKKERSREEKLVIDALKFVGLYDKVIRFPEGIYTKLTREFSNDGVVFSVGEMQKLALARAYASNCSMLILDEPSSALDPLAECEMLNNMMHLSKDKCAIIISHRLKDIKSVNCIYVMKKGVIIEYGTHDKLMKKRGLYFTMYNKQTREIEKISN